MSLNTRRVQALCQGFGLELVSKEMVYEYQGDGYLEIPGSKKQEYQILDSGFVVTVIRRPVHAYMIRVAVNGNFTVEGADNQTPEYKTPKGTHKQLHNMLQDLRNSKLYYRVTGRTLSPRPTRY